MFHTPFLNLLSMDLKKNISSQCFVSFFVNLLAASNLVFSTFKLNFTHYLFPPTRRYQTVSYVTL